MSQTNSAREFAETSMKYGDIWRKVAVITCRECGLTENIGIKHGYSLLPPTAIEKKFSKKGWTVGANPQWDICPICTEKKRAMKTQLKIVKEPEMKLVETIAKAVAVSEEPPRVMQREDRRIIFQKLNEVYLDEKRGYVEGWSDLRVSEDLGIPRAWVAQVRDENFGPVAANPEITEFKKGVEELREIKSMLEEYRALVARIDQLNIVSKLARLEKLAAEVNKHIP